MSETIATGYELWDTESRNLLDDFDTEVEALEAVHSLMALNGPECTDVLALTRVHADGRMATLAIGPDLATRAEAAGTERKRLPS